MAMCRYPLITVDWMRSHLGRMNKIRRCPPSLSETGVVAEALLFFVIYIYIYMRHAMFNPCSILWMYILNFKISEQYVLFFARLCKLRERLMLFHMKRGVSPQGSFRVDFHDFPVPNSEPMETSAGEEIPSAAPQWIELQNP